MGLKALMKNTSRNPAALAAKKMSSARLYIVVAVNAVGRSNSQAVVGLAATTQSTSSVEGTLDI